MILKNYLTKEQNEARKKIEEVAKECGLDFFKTHFFMLDFDQFNRVIANSGFPVRYNHWKFGMEYNQLNKQLGHGFGRVYELVINNNPAIAYVSDTIVPVHQRTIMAHVFAHVDFFKNNYAFKETNKNMINVMANHANTINKYIKTVGEEKVEKFIDACLSLENLIDSESVRIKRRHDKACEEEDNCENDPNCASCQGCSSGCEEKDKKISTGEEFRMKTKYPYMDDFINTPEFLESQRKKIQDEKPKKKTNPPEPERDVLLFILENSEKLTKWQKDVLSIIRDESYYFNPIGVTKIMNEGWASYWHDYMMTEKGLAEDDGIVEYAISNAGILRTNKTRINPYQLGIELFRDIKDRWDKGKHGNEYENEKNFQRRKKWNTQEGKGLEKIFEVRKTRNDLEFIREFMTDDFIRERMLYTFKLDPKDEWYKIANKDPAHVRNIFLNQLTNFGEPVIKVLDGNYRNGKELLLMHSFEGRILDVIKTRKTLENLFTLWGRTVYIHSKKSNGNPILHAFNGLEHKTLEAKNK
ncbi:MAG: SpoVR family protein [Nanoarchaeota archaeon]|nr:SpoVR family protein [Nanoarchaeota archaeon]MBU4351856.1 SpoVR family protein [Nanoarchaeota archaeon]